MGSIGKKFCLRQTGLCQQLILLVQPLLLFPVQPYLHIHRHAKRRPDDQKVHNIAAKIIFLCQKI